jgi:hypothetical protein
MDGMNEEVTFTRIRALLVEPGQFRTELLSAQNSVSGEISILEYQSLAEKIYERSRTDHGTQRQTPKRVWPALLMLCEARMGAAGNQWPKEVLRDRIPY